MTIRQVLGNVLPTGTTLSTANLLAVDGAAASIVSAGTGGTIQSSTVQIHSGSASIRVVGGGTTAPVIRLAFVGTSANAGAICAYHYGLALGAVDLINVRHAGGQLFRIALSGTGSVQIKDGTSGTTLGSTSPSAAWQPNRWNRIECRWNNSGGAAAGTATLECYNGDSLTPTGTLSLSGVNLGTAAAASIDFGTPNANSSTATNYFDSIQMDDGRTTFIGPYIPTTAPVVNTLSPVTIGPGEQKNIVASLASGAVDSWTWRQVSGTTTANSVATNTLTITGPSVFPPSNGTAVFGVKATDDGVDSTEATVTVTILPQISWTRVPGGNWVGSRVVSA